MIDAVDLVATIEREDIAASRATTAAEAFAAQRRAQAAREELARLRGEPIEVTKPHAHRRIAAEPAKTKRKPKVATYLWRHAPSDRDRRTSMCTLVWWQGRNDRRRAATLGEVDCHLCKRFPGRLAKAFEGAVT